MSFSTKYHVIFCNHEGLSNKIARVIGNVLFRLMGDILSTADALIKCGLQISSLRDSNQATLNIFPLLSRVGLAKLNLFGFNALTFCHN